jgi:hypothetical protein
MKKLLTAQTLFFASLVLIAAVSRWIPHVPNWTPLLGLALFAGCRLKPTWLAALVPLAAMLISDIALGFHETVVAVYVSLALIAVLPLAFAKTGAAIRVSSSLMMSGLAAIGFFMITNFGVWLSSGLYAKTAAGLWTAYVMGLPFLAGTFASTVLSLFAFYAFERLVLPQAIAEKA